jgi:hypothetical protein
MSSLIRLGAALAAAILLAGCSAEEAAPPPPAEGAEPAPAEPPASEPTPDATPAPAAAPAPPPAAEPPPGPAPAAEPGEATAGAPPEPAAAPLDLEELAHRLEQTSAIGVFTKLKLKNEFDDLLGSLRAHQAGRPGPTLAELREGYELLLMKVLALVQEEDAALARDLLDSREVIWMRLNDPDSLAGS